MSVKIHQLNYKNFYQADKTVAVAAFEQIIDDNIYEIKRLFIIFEDYNYNIPLTLKMLEDNEKNIIDFELEKIDHLPSFVTQIIRSTDLVGIASTNRYWSNVKINTDFITNNTHDWSYEYISIQHAFHDFVREKYYGKDLFVNACEDDDIKTAMNLWENGHFTQEDLKNELLHSQKTKVVFEKIQLHEDLQVDLKNQPNKKGMKI